MDELVPDNVSQHSRVSHASETYNEVRDLLHGVFRNNQASSIHTRAPSDDFIQQQPRDLREPRQNRNSSSIHNPDLQSLNSGYSYNNSGSSPPDKRHPASQFSTQPDLFKVVPGSTVIAGSGSRTNQGSDFDRLLAA